MLTIPSFLSPPVVSRLAFVAVVVASRSTVADLRVISVVVKGNNRNFTLIFFCN